MSDTTQFWVCKRCCGRGQHFLTCPTLRLPPTTNGAMMNKFFSITAPCQKCGEQIPAGLRGFGWNYLCTCCYDEEADHDAELGRPLRA
jgi:hypothetical protein